MAASGYGRMLQLVNDMPAHMAEALARARRSDLRLRRRFCKVAVAGMGGSAIGGDIARCILHDRAGVPVGVCRDYALPGWVGADTLLFCISYSGNTEETLTAYQQASRRRCQVICVTSGGRLGELARRNRDQVLLVPPGLPPRAAIGYLTVPLLYVLGGAGVYRQAESEIAETIMLLARRRAAWLPRARRLARLLHGRLPFVYSTSRLTDAVADRWRCQLNENSKVLCHTSVFPEHNHNEIVGMGNPGFLSRRSVAIALLDRETHKRTHLRLRFTRMVTQGALERTVDLVTEGGGRLARAFSLIALGDLASVELARLRGVDPMPVVRIDELKRLMAATGRKER